MGCRAFAALALLALCTGCSDAPGEQQSLAQGATIPAEWLPPSRVEGPGIIWVFRTDDCLTCQSLDYSLRRLQRTYHHVSLSTVHVGRREDAGIPKAFFANRRISVNSGVDLSPRQFRKEYGDVTLPVLLIRDGARITWSSAGASQPALTRAVIDSLFKVHIAAATLPTAAGPSGDTVRIRQE